MRTIRKFISCLYLSGMVGIGNRFIRILSTFLCMMVCQYAPAQSHFHNTQQFGLESTLLGGAVIAGSSDLSMAFYNPAGLRYAKDRGFDLALFMPALTVNNYGDFFNAGGDLKSRKLALNPSLITYKTDINDFDIVFSVLQKDVWDNHISYSSIKPRDVLDLTESFDYRYEGDEKWFGMSSYFTLSDRVSLGVSQFWAFQSASYHYSITSEALFFNDIQVNYFNQSLELDYSSLFSMVTKLGLSVDFLNDRFGLVVTTPYYGNILRSARFERSTAVLDSTGYGLETIVDFDLKPTLNSGWHVDLGYSRIFPDSSQVWLSGSLHTGVPVYDMLQIRRFGQDPLVIKNGTSYIVNLAAGYSRYISRRVQLIGSARTNFNAFKPIAPVNESESINVLEGNRLQFALGCKVRHGNSAFVIGLTYGVGIDGQTGQFNVFPQISRFTTNAGSLRHQSVTLMLTYEFIINTMSRNITRILTPKGK